MKKSFLLPITLLLLALALGTTGCRTLADEDPDSQEIPWSQPASWEGQGPMGMPGSGHR